MYQLTPMSISEAYEMVLEFNATETQCRAHFSSEALKSGSNVRQFGPRGMVVQSFLPGA